MIEWVARGAGTARNLDELIIATDDERIAETVRAYGRRVLMTDPGHESGTDRVAEVAALTACDLVVNIQGDEPLVRGEMIDALIEALTADSRLQMATLAHACPAAEADDPDAVKVVVDAAGRALYFSRAPIPCRSGGATPEPGYLRHIGLYAYRRDFLLRFAELAPTPLERTEALEQLRALEHGFAIGVIEIADSLIGVDTPADLERVRAILTAGATRADGGPVPVDGEKEAL